MTDYTIDVVLVMKIKIFVGITITGMAHGAKILVRIYSNAKIIQQISFPQVKYAPSGNCIFLQPQPVGRFHELFSTSVMTTQACLCHILRCFKFLL